ncbi:6170_t:CDS:10 [Paraglomus brasilianum]|uniref:6170_t:CDS:1 n=1 Tax=Paraglomus brasilianum TaxID=144538 RepID=A0A9N9AFD2_9GLOM|nr:6170_t:CDS:10 [Paraglomus brasilianum]
MSAELDLSIKSYFDSTPVSLWSYLGFLKTLKSYCISKEYLLDDLKSIWRKRYINFLSNFLEKEHDNDIKNRVTILIRQGCRPLCGMGCRSSALYLTIFSAVARPREGAVLLEKHPPEEESFWDGVKIERELMIKEDIFDKKSQIEALDVLCVSRSQKSNEYVNKVNSRLLKQAEISREKEVGTIIGQKRSYEEDLPSTPPGKIRTISTEVDNDLAFSDETNIANSEGDDLSPDDEIDDVSAEVQQFIAKMKRVKHRLFDYHIVNLSEQNQMDPVNKTFTDDEKKTMRKFWELGEPSAEEKLNTLRRSKWDNSIKQLVNKYTSAVELRSIFDEEESPSEIIFERPFKGKLVFRTHYDLLWIQDVYKRFILLFAMPFNALLDPDATEFAYRESFVNPIIPKAFDDVSATIRFKTGEVESTLRKQHRDETKGQKPRVNVGTNHDGILKICMNAKEIEVGFLEVVGNAVLVDVTKHHNVMDKLLKAMQISIFYQRRYHLQRNATEEQLECIQSYGVLVYQRETTIYTMHFKGGLHIVDILTSFIIPDNADQAYVLAEIMEKVYFFKVSI